MTRSIAILTLLLGAAPSLAVTTRVHEDATAEAFLTGKADGVVVTRAGLVRPGKRLESVATSETGIWALAFGGDGVLYAGTGNDGRILGVRGKEVTVVHETGTVLVAALATGPDGEVYAGTVPDGRIYRIEQMAAGRRVSLMAELPDPNVWCLDVDALGRVFAGTGPEGRVYRVAPDGRAEVVLETGDRDVLSLRVDGRGGFLAGTGGKGLLFHLTPEGSKYRTRVLHDFAEHEVRALALQDGKIYAALNQDLGGGQAKRAAGLVKQAVARIAKGDSKDPVAAEDEVGEKPSSGGTKALLKGSLWLVAAEGGAEKLLTFADGGLAALATDVEGGVLIAAGRGGRVFRYTADEGATLVHDLEADHAGALAVRGGKLAVVGGANEGSIHPVVEGGTPTYLSKVLDATFVSRWGVLTVETEVEGLTVETRSGNTAEPDATWSEWAARRAPDASLGEGAEGSLRAASPAARFVQYRLRWPVAAKGAVRRVTLAYLPRNQRPRLSPIKVNGQAPKKPEGAAPTPAPANKPAAHDPVRKISWKVDVVDGDAIRYSIHFRAIGDETWKPLDIDEKTLKGTTYSWDTASVPDGIYLVRVTASDAPGNAAGALEDVAVTDPFLVDNRKPAVEFTSLSEEELRGTATDGFSRITSLEVSVDGGEWAPLASTDGLLDETTESFIVRLPADLAKGGHDVAVRAKDAAGNVGVGTRAVKID